MKSLKNKIKNMKGITLVALIITVIVLLILAGVVINMTLGNDGIISKAQGAVDMYKNSQEKEEIEIAKATNEIDNIINSSRLTTEKGINYSLNETKTNDTWMGKPIYTKVIYISALPNKKDDVYNHNIEDIDNIWINTGKSFIIIGDEHVPLPSLNLLALNYRNSNSC